MPSAVSSGAPPKSGITKFTNCRVLRGDELVDGDVWISSVTGRVVRSQAAFFDEYTLPDTTVDLGGRIVAPGFIECQLNGAFGFNFSTVFDDDDGDGGMHATTYTKKMRDLNRRLVRTGVTSYVPTVTSQTSDLYRRVLPFLAPSGHRRDPADGAESLGAHVEGPFLNPSKNGVHNPNVMRQAHTFADLEDMYGRENLTPSTSAVTTPSSSTTPTSPSGSPSTDSSSTSRSTTTTTPVRMITAAPELGNMTALIPELAARGIVFAMGHSEATYEEASAAVAAGATMITHLFNAMRPLHHRNPGIFGVLGESEAVVGRKEKEGDDKRVPAPARPFYGVIADGIHLHPTTVKIAFNAHPDGFVLVTDAMHMVGCPDGPYEWTNGDKHQRLVKNGNVLLLENSNTLAGSTITLIECVENFLNWTGSSLPQALRAVTATPAAMLGLRGVKGTLEPGADADLVILSEARDGASTRLSVDEVWKFGVQVS